MSGASGHALGDAISRRGFLGQSGIGLGALAATSLLNGVARGAGNEGRGDLPHFIGKAKRGVRTRDELMVLLMPHRPIAPLEGAIFMEVDWVYPWRKCEPKKNKVDGKLPCFTRPDCDNLCKFFADICERLGFYLDDAQVADLRFRKMWGDRPGIGVKMGRLGE